MAINKRLGTDGKTTRYTVQVVIPNPSGKGRGKRVSVGTFRTKRDAERAEQRAKDEIATGTFALTPPEPPRIVTVAESVTLWLDTKRPKVSANTLSGYESAARLHLLPALGDIDITQLTLDDVQHLVSDMSDRGIGAQLIHRAVMVLHGALHREVRGRKLLYNVADGVEVPRVHKRKDLTIWTPDQMRAFLAVVEDDELYPFWHLTLLEGMRRSEALGLRWRDLRWSPDETQCTAIVAQTVVPDLTRGGAPLVKPRGKTSAAHRSVVLTTPTISALKLHRDRQRFRAQAIPDWPDHDLIVTTPVGGVVRPDMVRVNRDRLMKAAGVPHVDTHSLRHTAATVMIQAGVPLPIVSQKIGHASIGTTVDIYGHIAASEQAQANAAMHAYLERVTSEVIAPEDVEHPGEGVG